MEAYGLRAHSCHGTGLHSASSRESKEMVGGVWNRRAKLLSGRLAGGVLADLGRRATGGNLPTAISGCLEWELQWAYKAPGAREVHGVVNRREP